MRLRRGSRPRIRPCGKRGRSLCKSVVVLAFFNCRFPTTGAMRAVAGNFELSETKIGATLELLPTICFIAFRKTKTENVFRPHCPITEMCYRANRIVRSLTACRPFVVVRWGKYRGRTCHQRYCKLSMAAHSIFPKRAIQLVPVICANRKKSTPIFLESPFLRRQNCHFHSPKTRTKRVKIISFC